MGQKSCPREKSKQNPLTPTSSRTPAITSTRKQEKVRRKEIQYKSNLKTVVEMINDKRFRKEHLQKLKECLPFWDLFHSIKEGHITLENCRKSDKAVFEIAKTYERTTQMFNMGKHHVSITKDDIANIFGISKGTKEVHVTAEKKTESSFVRRTFDGIQKMSKVHIEKALDDAVERKNKEGIDDVVRLVTLFMLLTLFVSTSSPRIGWGYIAYIKDVELIKKFDWASLIYSRLSWSLQNNSPDKLIGCVIAIPFVMMERFNISKPIKLDNDIHVLCAKWKLKELNKQIKKHKTIQALCSVKGLRTDTTTTSRNLYLLDSSSPPAATYIIRSRTPTNIKDETVTPLRKILPKKPKKTSIEMQEEEEEVQEKESEVQIDKMIDDTFDYMMEKNITDTTLSQILRSIKEEMECGHKTDEEPSHSVDLQFVSPSPPPIQKKKEWEETWQIEKPGPSKYKNRNVERITKDMKQSALEESDSGDLEETESIDLHTTESDDYEEMGRNDYEELGSDIFEVYESDNDSISCYILSDEDKQIRNVNQSGHHGSREKEERPESSSRTFVQVSEVEEKLSIEEQKDIEIKKLKKEYEEAHAQIYTLKKEILEKENKRANASIEASKSMEQGTALQQELAELKRKMLEKENKLTEASIEACERAEQGKKQQQELVKVKRDLLEKENKLREAAIEARVRAEQEKEQQQELEKMKRELFEKDNKLSEATRELSQKTKIWKDEQSQKEQKYIDMLRSKNTQLENLTNKNMSLGKIISDLENQRKKLALEVDELMIYTTAQKDEYEKALDQVLTEVGVHELTQEHKIRKEIERELQIKLQTPPSYIERIKGRKDRRAKQEFTPEQHQPRLTRAQARLNTEAATSATPNISDAFDEMETKTPNLYDAFDENEMKRKEKEMETKTPNLYDAFDENEMFIKNKRQKLKEKIVEEETFHQTSIPFIDLDQLKDASTAKKQREQKIITKDWDVAKLLPEDVFEKIAVIHENKGITQVLWRKNDNEMKAECFVTLEHIYQIMEGKSLSNSVIQGHAEFLRSELNSDAIRHFCIFNPLIWTYIKQAEKYSVVRKKEIDDIIEDHEQKRFKFLMFPMNSNNGMSIQTPPNHWTLLVYHTSKSTWYYYNSNLLRGKDQYLLKDARLVVDYVVEKMNENNTGPSFRFPGAGLTQTEIYPAENCPQQGETLDCALFVCYIMEKLARHLRVPKEITKKELNAYKACIVTKFIRSFETVESK